MKRAVIALILLFALAIPAYGAECCNLNLQTKESCGNENILHQGKCTGNEAFLLEYDPINKRYILLKSFENGNEFLKLGETKLYATAKESITAIPGNNERLQLNLKNKSLVFNGVENNLTGFLTRYGVRAYTSGSIEIPTEAYVAIIDITVSNNKTSFELKQGEKKDITLTHAELDTLKDTSFKYPSQNLSFNGAERLSFNGLYADSGSFFSSKPEPFLEADRASYLLAFIDDVILTNLSASSSFNIKLLNKDAAIYEISPPDRILLSFDGKINFREDGESYDNKWKWTVSAYSQKLAIGFDAKNIRQSGCIDIPLGYAKACARPINKSGLFLLNASLKNLTLNNKTATLIEINSDKLVYALPTRQLQKMFIADELAYRKLVLAQPDQEKTAATATTNENISANISSAAQKGFKLPNLFTLKNLKILLYALFGLLFIIFLIKDIKFVRNS